MKYRSQFLNIHRWLGLCSGIILCLIGLSGSILVYRNSIDRLLNPSLYAIETTGERISFDSLYDIISRRESFTSCSLDIPPTPGEIVEFTLTLPSENYYSRPLYFIDVNPYTGKILREGYCSDLSSSFTHWIMYFHDSFQFGKVGMLIVALGAVALFLSIITGLFVHGKNIFNVLSFRIPLRKQRGIGLYRSLHLYVGVWTLLFTIVVFFTGFWMLKSVLSPSGWRFTKPGPVIHSTTSIDSCLRRSTVILHGFIPDYVALPAEEDEPIEIDGNIAGSFKILNGDASFLKFDSRTGEVLEVFDNSNAPFPQNLTAAFWSLHVGNYGGNLIKLIYVLGGLMPGVLAVSGYVLWWKRKRMLTILGK